MSTGDQIPPELMEKRIHEVLKVCHRSIDFMWASKIAAILLGCEFRDADLETKKYFASKYVEGNHEQS